MNMENIEVKEKETEKISFELGDRVKYKKDGREGIITREEGDLHLGEGLIEITFGDDDPKGVSVADLEKIEGEPVEE